MNPYKILGLYTDATVHDVKKAYRQMAARFHPDHGGSIEKMKEFTMARDILIDPVRRKLFDETGETGETEKQSDADKVQDIISGLLADAVAQDERDAIKWICERINARREDAREQAKRHTAGRDRLAKKLAKFELSNRKTKNINGRDFIVGNLQSGIDQFNRSIESLTQTVDLMTEALTFLNDLSLPSDPPEDPFIRHRSQWPDGGFGYSSFGMFAGTRS